MKNYLLIIFLTILTFTNISYAQENIKIQSNSQNITPDSSDSFNNPSSLKNLNRSQFKNDFYQLINFYQPQINPLYCAIASSVMIINALNYGEINNQIANQITKPNGDIVEYKILTQQNFLNKATDKIKNRDIINFKKPSSIIKEGDKRHEIFDPGLTLGQLSAILEEVYHLDVTKIHLTESDQINEFRKRLINVLQDQNNFILANFDGKILNKTSNGHISPIVAYNQFNDEVLILDSALHKNKWFWTSLETIVKAMNTKDGDNYRGYLIISKKNN
jgi:hypothetical protein